MDGRVKTIDATHLTAADVARCREAFEAEGYAVTVAGTPRPAVDPRVVAVAALAALAAPGSYDGGTGGGYHKQTLADRTPPPHRRFPVPKRK